MARPYEAGRANTTYMMGIWEHRNELRKVTTWYPCGFLSLPTPGALHGYPPILSKYPSISSPPRSPRAQSSTSSHEVHSLSLSSPFSILFGLSVDLHQNTRCSPLPHLPHTSGILSVLSLSCTSSSRYYPFPFSFLCMPCKPFSPI